LKLIYEQKMNIFMIFLAQTEAAFLDIVCMKS